MNFSVSNISDLGRRFLQSNILLYFVVLLLAVKLFSGLIFINFPQNIFFADITKATLEIFANQTRQSLGLAPLSESQKLNQAARLKAEDMVQNQYFSHTSPIGITPWFWFLRTGYNYKYAGENLAIGFFDSEQVYNAWLNSPSHRANLINPNYKEIGTAVLQGFGQNNAIIVVQLFGSLQPEPKREPVEVKEPPEENTNVPENNGQAVLSQSTESPFLSFMVYNYDELLESIVFGISLLIIGVLVFIIIFSPTMFSRKEFILRSAVLLISLAAADLLSQNIITLIIPHNITI
jgi:hypothetical protein